jgi:hypothetical protein
MGLSRSISAATRAASLYLLRTPSTWGSGSGGGLLLPCLPPAPLSAQVALVTASRARSGGLCNGQEELELRGQLLLCVQPVRKVDAADAAIGVDLDAQCLHVVGAYSVGSREEVVNNAIADCLALQPGNTN